MKTNGTNGTNLQGWSSETGQDWESTEGYRICHIGYGQGGWVEHKFQVKDPDHKVIAYTDRVGEAIDAANLDLYMARKSQARMEELDEDAAWDTLCYLS